MADRDYETKIKITGDSAGAEDAISRLAKRLRSIPALLTAIRSAISGMMRALGLFYMATEGVNRIVEGYKKLCEWIHRAAIAARELAISLRSESIATAVANTVAAYRQLNKEIAETNRLESERNAIADRRKDRARTLEDARLELKKQSEIAALDPASESYAEDRAAIERSYARRRSSLAARRAGEDARADGDRLYAAADRKDRQANELQKKYDRLMREDDRQVELVWRLGMDARHGVEGAQERHDEEEKKHFAIVDEAMKIKEAVEAMRQEANSLRSAAAETMGGGVAAQMRDTTEQKRISNEERAEAARAAKADAERARMDNDRLASAQAAVERETQIAALDPAAEDFAFRRDEINRSFRRRELETRRDALSMSAARQTNNTALQAERLEVDAQIAALDNAERMADVERRRQEAQRGDRAAERLAAVDYNAGSRLNAMGLGAGSGVQRVQQEMANSLKDLVQLGRDQLSALKDIRNEDAGATFQ